MKSHIQKSTNHFFWDNVIARSHIALTIHLKLYTKFEVSSSSSFEDIFNRIPKILGVTWPRPRPLWGKFCTFLFTFAKI